MHVCHPQTMLCFCCSTCLLATPVSTGVSHPQRSCMTHPPVKEKQKMHYLSFSASARGFPSKQTSASFNTIQQISSHQHLLPATSVQFNPSRTGHQRVSLVLWLTSKGMSDEYTSVRPFIISLSCEGLCCHLCDGRGWGRLGIYRLVQSFGWMQPAAAVCMSGFYTFHRLTNSFRGLQNKQMLKSFVGPHMQLKWLHWTLPVPRVSDQTFQKPAATPSSFVISQMF